MKYLSKITQQQNKLFIFSGIILGMWLLTQIPYVSLFLSPVLLLFFTYIVAMILFRIPPKITVWVALFLLLFSFPWILVGSRVHAESFGIGSFLLLSIAFLQIAWQTRKSA
jgi:hypothetical protein